MGISVAGNAPGNLQEGETNMKKQISGKTVHASMKIGTWVYDTWWPEWRGKVIKKTSKVLTIHFPYGNSWNGRGDTDACYDIAHCMFLAKVKIHKLKKRKVTCK